MFFLSRINQNISILQFQLKWSSTMRLRWKIMQFRIGEWKYHYFYKLYLVILGDITYDVLVFTTISKKIREAKQIKSSIFYYNVRSE